MTGDCHAGIRGSRGLRCPRPPDSLDKRASQATFGRRPLRTSTVHPGRRCPGFRSRRRKRARADPQSKRSEIILGRRLMGAGRDDRSHAKPAARADACSSDPPLPSRTWKAAVSGPLLPYLSRRLVSSGRSRFVGERATPAGGAWARWAGQGCARVPGLTLVHDPAVQRAGDKMFDGVIPLGEALRPLDLSGPSTRACRQQQWGSRPRRIGVSEGLTRANDLLDGGSSWFWCAGLLAGARCCTAEPKPGSSGNSICTLAGCRSLGPGRAAD